MSITERKISHDELARTLPLTAVTQIRNDVLEACAETVEEHGPLPVGVEFWYRSDGELLALAQSDDVEAGIDHGDGTLLAEFEVGPAFHRCMTCGMHNRQATPWCSRRCRNLLRAEGRRLVPGATDEEALATAETWGARRRSETVGWHGPLTKEIAEALWFRP